MRLAILTLLALLLMAPKAPAGRCPTGDRACGIRGLPDSVVKGIIMVESGGAPRALHVGIGKGYSFYPRDRSEARRFLAVALALTDNVDIGLMQVNWRTWGNSVRALGLGAYDLLDARTNLKVGCRILAQVLSGRGTFLARLGRYHSLRPERGRWYARRVLAAARELDAQGGAVVDYGNQGSR